MTARCARHPEVETTLRCSKCETPICPKCLVYTHAGARCPACAQMRRSPPYDPTLRHYLAAAGASLGLGPLLGAAWAFLPAGDFFSLILGAGLGYALGEAVSLATNRKRGRGLQALAVMGLGAAFATHAFLLYRSPLLGLTDPWGLLALAVGAITAVSRLG
ncbi:MAG: hypothetical protein HY687_05890 [Chloroflexi bacterium]|nr:hypothetical protein [Chloroflexota bacterium]